MGEKREYLCDLHIHSCLSPCADILMTPGNIIKRALHLGLDCIAITDHNTAGNIEPALELAAGTELTIIPGMEVESMEEIHLLCLFPELEQLKEWALLVEKRLPDLSNNEGVFGYQLLVDENDEYIAKEEKLLAAASGLSINEIVSGVSLLGGIVIPSHIDRAVNSIIGQLGFIPADLELSIIEFSRNTLPSVFLDTHSYLKEYSYIISSDSHYLKDIGDCGQDSIGFKISEGFFERFPGLK